ncbi:ATP-dependent Clp protease ATP-binding subunit [Saccharothrix coeruleofusca]|uniref:Clp R domain-containing protein n=1 Tax=Saccharothrix coeruleofusca TaxID=33919 RepID=A0A918AQ91_9PSEU|nr:ATP-dependent Clp protease ATP-binding subunit [Saccharothrix coeruleofusca]MBP2337807.1 ATP-dependent Clp protease ATP-binding subunit ClpC [Saccharothrix coeruleofusca]GGP62402.1 hypothetical protein GCM10010185_38540 [Saccharothrix coeruleofusca]
MPKINVYLPDELAEQVKQSGVPVSAICQRALEQSVRRVAAIRAMTLDDLATPDPNAQLSQLTDRARTALRLAIEHARADGAAVGTEHLLRGVLDEGDNLALRVLRVLEVSPERVARALPAPSAPGSASGFSGPAANALELSVTEAISLGHNYVGCEHLLLGLLAEPDGSAGAVLRELGVDSRSTRQAVVAALSGYAQLRANTQQADPAALVAAVVRRELEPVLARIERLEAAAQDPSDA